ncbi:MAG: hypothetical protein J6S79_05145 [Lachnospiraceae bacterium]|nr:hypothetical protein [Lachnospiraceae bacterium]
MRHLFKKLIVWTLCLALAVGILPGLARGAKAETTVAEIDSYQDLLDFAERVNNGETTLNAKIVVKEIDASASNPKNLGYDAQTTAWTPIGSYSSPYTGKFDGNGCTITGLTIESKNDYIGLFGYVGEGGCVQNVNLEGGSIKGNNNVGGVTGGNNGTVSNCSNTGAVSGNDNVGGVTGSNNGTVSNCSNTGAVSGNNKVGGVTGGNNGTVSNCSNTGAVSGNDNVGGVTGLNPSGRVSNCSNTGAVSGSNYVGGTVGDNGGTVSHCLNTGDVKGSRDSVGGVVGDNYFGTVSHCFNTGMVDGEDYFVGGVVGNSIEGTVSNCYNTGDVTGSGKGEKVGGVVGNIYMSTVMYCYNTGDVKGNIDVGGVAGEITRGTVSKCFYNTSICQIGGSGFDYSGSDIIGLTTLQMIGASSILYDNLKDVKDDDGNLVWLFRRNTDGAYYPHLAGFNFDKSGKQLIADKITGDEWPGKAVFSVTLSDDCFTFNGDEYKPVVGNVTLDNEEITVEKETYLDNENNEVIPKDAGVYRVRISWTEDNIPALEKTFEILPAQVTLTADSASAECDGTALIKNSYTISGLAKGDSVVSVTITGSQTGPGSSDNVPSAAKIVNDKGEDVTDCYDITYLNGKLTVAEHSFEQKVTDAKYQKSAATCTEAAVYYKSCACGEKSTETFESGEPLGHDYKAVEGSAVAPTCEKAGKEADQKCERCGDVINGKEIPATGHTWKAATGYAPKTCEICGATEGDVIKYTVEGGNTIEFTQGDTNNVVRTYHRSEDDKHAIDHHKGVQIDGKDVKVDAKSGSVILTFDAATLNALGVGDHVITVIFDDWIDELKLVIKAPVAPIADATPTTGDSSLPVLWVTLLLLSMAGASAVVMRRRKRA